MITIKKPVIYTHGGKEYHVGNRLYNKGTGYAGSNKYVGYEWFDKVYRQYQEVTGIKVITDRTDLNYLTTKGD